MQLRHWQTCRAIKQRYNAQLVDRQLRKAQIHSNTQGTKEIFLGPERNKFVPVDGDVLVEKPGKDVDCEDADVVGFTSVAGIYNKCV